MLTQQTLDKLHTLRLTGMREAFAQQLEQPATHELSFEERLALLLDRELLYRDNRRLTRLLKEAKLRLAAACVEDIDYRHQRGLQRPQMAARQGHAVRYLRLPRLLEQLGVARGDGSYARLMSQLAKADLLILDDWGIQSLSAPQRNDLMEIIEDRHGLRSTLIASQLPVDRWHDYLGEPTLADAILDRLLHNAHRLPLSGESMRKTTADLTQRDRSK
jgi:DNA replication protein DnaC